MVEAERDAALRRLALDRYEIMDTPAEQGFDDIVTLATIVCHAPVALISLLSDDRQWFKANLGFPFCETPLSQSVCAHTVAADQLLVIPDLLLDRRTCDNVLVTGAPNVRFYAGAPLRDPDGTVLGALCVMDVEPRPDGLTAPQRTALEALAAQVMTQMRLRRALVQAEELARERRTAEIATAREHEDVTRLAALVEQSGDFIAMTAPDGRVLFVNPAGLRLVGLASLEAACALTIDDYFVRDERPALTAAVQPAVAARNYWEGEMTFRHHRGGDDVPVLYNTFPLRDATGRIAAYGTVTRDLRETRRAQARRVALLELSDLLGGVAGPGEMAAAASAVIVKALAVDRAVYGTLDPNGTLTTVANDGDARSPDGTHRLLEFAPYVDDLRRGWAVVIPDVRWDDRTAAEADSYEERQARALVDVPVLEGGEMVAILSTSKTDPYDWTKEEVAFMRNVAERTRSAIERRRAETELRSLAASLELRVEQRTRERDRVWAATGDLMATVGHDGYLKSVNPAWTKMLGWTEQELLTKPFSEITQLEDNDEAARVLERIVAGEKVAGFVDRVILKDGGTRTIMWDAAPDGDVFHVVGRDITELRRIEDQLRQSQKMEAVGQLTGGLAHDFNNLLTGVTGSLELIQTRIGQGRVAEVDRYATAALGAARRAAALTHRLLAFSRRQTLSPKPTDVNRLVAGMEELVRRTLGPHVMLDVTAAAGLWTTLVDPGQLENALLNLCLNARDAMPEGGRLLVETGNRTFDARAASQREIPPGQYIALGVSDTGIGMPPDVVAKAFDPFFTTKPIGQGTGLGLSMIYGFARQSGGRARIYSELGKGTVVRLYLPRHIGEGVDDEIAGRLDPAPPRAKHGETVLVVDDEPTVRMLVADVMKDLGYTAIEAEDGEAALEVLQSDVPLDLLVTDVGLPGGLNGRQVADAGRVSRPGLRVLFITGFAENAVLNHGHLDPGMQVLTKPFAVDDLADRIRALIALDR